MILTFHEGACIRASAGDTTLVFGPISKASKNFKPTNFGADVALISLNHPDMNGASEAGRGDKQPFIISGPGEYEIKETTVAGFPSGSFYNGPDSAPPSRKASDEHGKATTGKEGRINTVYSVHFDGMSLMYLGALGDLDLPADILEMDAPDILIVPIGGKGTLNPAEAQKLAVKLEAKIIIPILYDLPRLASGKAGDQALKQFLKEAGEESVKPVDKLTLKPRDLVDKGGDVFVLGA